MFGPVHERYYFCYYIILLNRSLLVRTCGPCSAQTAQIFAATLGIRRMIKKTTFECLTGFSNQTNERCQGIIAHALRKIIPSSDCWRPTSAFLGFSPTQYGCVLEQTSLDHVFSSSPRLQSHPRRAADSTPRFSRPRPHAATSYSSLGGEYILLATSTNPRPRRAANGNLEQSAWRLLAVWWRSIILLRLPLAVGRQ